MFFVLVVDRGRAARDHAVEGPKPIVVYTAWALNMLGGGGGTTVTIGIYRWSSDAERTVPDRIF